MKKSVICDYNTRNLISVLTKDRCILMRKEKCVLGVIRLVFSLYSLKRESRSINKFWRYRFCVIGFRIRNEIRLRASE
jgi:hypothetical protein